MTVLRNRGRWDRSNARFEDGRVVAYDKANPGPDMEWIDYGLGAFRARAFEIADAGTVDLADVYAQLSRRELLAGYAATERFYEIGTPEALRETDAFLHESVAVEARRDQA